MIKVEGKNKVNIIVIILFILITIISCNLHLIHYDNYSHWGLIVRVLFDFDRLPNFENNYVIILKSLCGLLNN